MPHSSISTSVRKLSRIWIPVNRVAVDVVEVGDVAAVPSHLDELPPAHASEQLNILFDTLT